MDPFELLKEDHETVSKLFKRIETASGRVKLIRFRKLKAVLDLHTHIEETIFYPALKNADESRDITLEAYEEHKVVKNLLAKLDGAKIPSDTWTAKFTVLKENIEHHVEEEEGELFSKAREVLTTEQAEALGDQMAEQKEKQGGTVSERVEKPGLIKTVVKALFGGGTGKKAGKKEAEGKAGKTKAASTKKRSRKQGAKRASKKPGKETTAKTRAKATPKSSSKKAAAKAKTA
jgi:hemerythrin-like domain-containing protein